MRRMRGILYIQLQLRFYIFTQLDFVSVLNSKMLYFNMFRATSFDVELDKKMNFLERDSRSFRV